MASVQRLRAFVTERLTAAAEEILGAFEKTVEEYEEEIGRQRRLLDVVWRPEVKLHRLGELTQQHVCKEERILTDDHFCRLENNFTLDQEEPDPPQIKEEQEEGTFNLLTQDNSSVLLIPTCDDSKEPVGVHKILPLSSPLVHSGDISPMLETHCKTDTDEKISKCDTCGKTFRYRSRLQRHLRVHTGEKPYACDACGKRFRQSSQLKVHLRIHTREKPYLCKMCGRPFRHSGDLKIHMRRAHIGEKSYLCHTCGQSFTENTLLRQHMIIHTGEKPFSCELWGKRFTRGRALLVHMRSHTGEKPYFCKTWEEIYIQQWPAGPYENSQSV